MLLELDRKSGDHIFPIFKEKNVERGSFFDFGACIRSSYLSRYTFQHFVRVYLCPHFGHDVLQECGGESFGERRPERKVVGVVGGFFENEIDELCVPQYGVGQTVDVDIQVSYD